MSKKSVNSVLKDGLWKKSTYNLIRETDVKEICKFSP